MIAPIEDSGSMDNVRFLFAQNSPLVLAYSEDTKEPFPFGEYKAALGIVNEDVVEDGVEEASAKVTFFVSLDHEDVEFLEGVTYILESLRESSKEDVNADS